MAAGGAPPGRDMAQGNWHAYRRVNTGIPAYIPTAEIDAHMSAHMTQMGADKAAVAFGFNGSFMAWRSYGCPIDRRFRMASLAKNMTGSAVKKIINAGTGGLTLSTLAAAYLGYNAPADSRVSNITVNHLIQHQAGYNDAVGTNHVFNNRTVADALGVTSPPTDAQLVQYALNNETLNFNPGSATNYANINYIILGEIIKAATGVSYHKYVQDMLMSGKGARFIRGMTLAADQDKREVDYLESGTTNSIYGAAPGEQVPWPYGGFGVHNMTAGGGWVSTIYDLGLYYAGIIPGGPWPAPPDDPFPTETGWSYSRTEAGSMPGSYAPSSRRWNQGGAEGTDNLRFAVAMFNRRTGTAADDEIAAELDADLQLFV